MNIEARPCFCQYSTSFFENPRKLAKKKKEIASELPFATYPPLAHSQWSEPRTTNLRGFVSNLCHFVFYCCQCCFCLLNCFGVENVFDGFVFVPFFTNKICMAIHGYLCNNWPLSGFGRQFVVLCTGNSTFVFLFGWQLGDSNVH